MEIYIVNWRYTTITDDDTMDFDSGTCETAFKTKEEAVEHMLECIQSDYENCDDEDATKTIREDSGCVNSYGNTYEYWVTGVYFE